MLFFVLFLLALVIVIGIRATAILVLLIPVGFVLIGLTTGWGDPKAALPALIERHQSQ